MSVLFDTDEQLANRLLAVERKLRAEGLEALAAEVAAVAQILAPERSS